MDVQFQFWDYCPTPIPAWQPLQAYSLSDTYLWTPATAGSYLLAATARDSIVGDEVQSLVWYTVLSPPLSAVDLTISPTSPQEANTKMTLTAAATGGTEVQYQFWVYNPSVTPAWSQLQSYSATPTCCWTPATTAATCSPPPRGMAIPERK